MKVSVVVRLSVNIFKRPGVFDQVMQPSLEDLQQSLNKACQLVVDVSKGVHQWGQKTTGIMSVNIFKRHLL